MQQTHTQKCFFMYLLRNDLQRQQLIFFKKKDMFGHSLFKAPLTVQPTKQTEPVTQAEKEVHRYICICGSKSSGPRYLKKK